MELKYNDVEFSILTLDRVERNCTYSSDGTTVLWVDWNILASCVYAPSIPGTSLGGTSVSLVQQDGAHQLAWPHNREHGAGTSPASQNPTAGADPRPLRVYNNGLGHPIFTDQEILERLSIPRRPLIISAWIPDSRGDLQPLATTRQITWLESPRNGLPSDCKHGPIVKSSPVVSAQGQANSFAVQLEIQTWVPPTEQDRLVLSHRWQSSLGRSEGDYLVRSITGEVIFHAGLMRKEKANPSWLLSQFLHPIPLGFRRHLGPITLSPDGTVLRYEYQDEDQTVVFSPGHSGCTEVELVVSGGVSIPALRV